MCVVRAFFLNGVWMRRPCCFRLFEVAYLLYTTLSGAFSAAVRQVYAVLLNLLVLLRPDLRIFPLFATLDVVHGAYLSALYVDHAHTNPVLRAAVEVRCGAKKTVKKVAQQNTHAPLSRSRAHATQAAPGASGCRRRCSTAASAATRSSRTICCTSRPTGRRTCPTSTPAARASRTGCVLALFPRGAGRC